ncbi:unnamed protein product [Boreogadus saida]
MTRVTARWQQILRKQAVNWTDRETQNPRENIIEQKGYGANPSQTSGTQRGSTPGAHAERRMRTRAPRTKEPALSRQAGLGRPRLGGRGSSNGEGLSLPGLEHNGFFCIPGLRFR